METQPITLAATDTATPIETVESLKAEITRLQNENLMALDQINKWCSVVEMVNKKNLELEKFNDRLRRDMQDINKMQTIMTNLNMQRNKNRKGIVLPPTNRII